MDVIKDMAKQFSSTMHINSHSLESFDSALTSNLVYINKQSEKVRFLSYLIDIIETQYQEHMKVCKNPEVCPQNKYYEIALYSSKQQFDDYNDSSDNLIIEEKPAMKYFSEGQHFDAYTEIKECIKKASKSIVLIDNYVDINTLTFFHGKEPAISLKIITNPKSNKEDFKRATQLYNKQFENLVVKESNEYHDRFLIIDDNSFFHIGTSIKDAGNKTFMFSRIEDTEIRNIIRQKIID